MLCFNSEGEPVSNALLHSHFSLHPGISVFQPCIVRAQCHAAGHADLLTEPSLT